MALQFDPSPYLQAFQYGQRNKPTGTETAQQINQGAGNLGDTLMQMLQMQKQNRAGTLDLGLKFREAGMNPDAAMQYYRTGQLPQDNTQADTSGSMSTGQTASAGMPDTGTGEGRMAPSQPSIVDLHNQHLQSQGLPGVPSQSPSKNSQPSGFSSLFQTSPIEMSKAGDPNYLMTLPEKQRGMVEKQREFQTTQDRLNEDRSFRQSMEKQNFGIREADSYQKKLSNAQNALVQVRGDQSLSRTEEQRDAAITAYNRLSEIEQKGQLPNPIDYVDILGQIYKARTGSAPTNEILQTAKQETAKGNFNKWYTYFTGNQAPATSQNISASLKDMASSMGMQADKLHEGYMAPRMQKITMGLKPEDAQQLINAHRGMTFQEATGYRPGQQTSGLMWKGRPLKDTPANRAWLAAQGGNQ